MRVDIGQLLLRWAVGAADSIESSGSPIELAPKAQPWIAYVLAVVLVMAVVVVSTKGFRHRSRDDM